MSAHSRLPPGVLDALIARAREAQPHAHAPYSGFLVGAAVLAPSGQIYPGVNVENAAYPVGNCAEQVAIGAAVTAGERHFVAVCVVTDADQPALPCGGCRQTLNEFNPDMLVIAVNLRGDRRMAVVRELLPDGFSGHSLG
jgi:cytidine deaminase